MPELDLFLLSGLHTLIPFYRWKLHNTRTQALVRVLISLYFLSSRMPDNTDIFPALLSTLYWTWDSSTIWTVLSLRAGTNLSLISEVSMLGGSTETTEEFSTLQLSFCRHDWAIELQGVFSSMNIVYILLTY